MSAVEDRPQLRGPVMPTERDPAPADVLRARDGVRHAGLTYGRRTPERTLGRSWRGFVHRYGWRAYALPVLVIITVASLLTDTQVRKHFAVTPRAAARHAVPVAPPIAAGSFTLKGDPSGPNANEAALTSAELPAGAPYAKQGKGTFTTLPGTAPRVGTGRLYRYSVEVEDGVDGIDPKQFQQLVVSVLSDHRSWSGHGVSLERVDSGRIDFRVSLTSSMTVRKLCGYSIPVETSCFARAGGNSPVNRVVLNDARWARGSTAYVGDLAAYRIYMINHEDGHALGHQHAHQCLPGGLAPVMLQQTFGLRSAATGKNCQANPWPYPAGVKGAPGPEQPDTAANDEYGRGD